MAAVPLAGATLRVGIEVGTEPITFLDEAGRPAGFAVELMNSIAREMQFEVVYVPAERAAMFADFREKKTDALAHAVFTENRRAHMAFAVSHLEFEGTLFVKRGDRSIRSLEDLRKRRIAILSGTMGHEYLKRHGFGPEHFIEVSGQREALRAISDGLADATITASLLARKAIHEENLDVMPAEQVELHDLVYRFHAVVHPDDREWLAILNEGLARIRENGAYDEIYERWIGPLEPRPLRFSEMKPYLLPAGILLMALLGFMVWQRGMLARLARQADALRRSEERLTLVLEGGDHGLWDRDFAAGQVERNDRILNKLGYTGDEIGTALDSWAKLIHPDDLPAFLAIQDQLEKSPDAVFSAEYRMRAKDGSWRWMHSRGRVIERRPDGSPLRAAGTHTDITERKLAEEERVTLQRKALEAQKLESLGLLAGGIAHDFNNLLTVILGQSSLARLSLADTQVTRDAFDQIESAGQRAADLCRQMLAYAGGTPLARQTIDLNTLVSELTPLLRASVVKDATLRFELAPLLPAIEADPTQMRQVIMNLVINASEALGPGGGTIRVTTALRGPRPDELSHAVHDPGPAPLNPVCLSVADTGCGMKPELRAKIFEPFFTTKFTGRGLGLASVLGIARAHQSLFCLQSEPGAGSTFALFFPASTGPAAPRPAGEAAEIFTRRRGRILLADDEPALISVILPMLKRQGYEVVTAVDGREAVEKFNASPEAFVAVILDCTMPKLDGIGALEAMRRLRPHVPALITSGFGAVEALSRLPEDRWPAFLQKPFTYRDLSTRLASVLGGARG